MHVHTTHSTHRHCTWHTGMQIHIKALVMSECTLHIQIEALQTEVLALKSLLQSPVKIETPTHKAKQKSPLRKSLNFSKKAKDDKNARLPQSSSDMMLPVHATPFTVIEHKSTPRGACIQHGEPLPVEFEEFRQWVENISLSRDNPYMARILHTDIKPCLNFADKEVSAPMWNRELRVVALPMAMGGALPRPMGGRGGHCLGLWGRSIA